MKYLRNFNYSNKNLMTKTKIVFIRICHESDNSELTYYFKNYYFNINHDMCFRVLFNSNKMIKKSHYKIENVELTHYTIQNLK